MTFSKPLGLLFTGALLLSAQSGRLDRHDRNNDGVVDRSEWRGNARVFDRHDWNRDGVLSGDELTGNRDNMRNRDNTQTRNRDAGRVDNDAGRLDKNANGVVEGYEWPYNGQIFRDLDRDGNSVLSRDELNNINSATLPQLDRNGDRKIDENEWPGGFAQFERLDQDNNGTVTSQEYFGRGGEWQRRQRFDSWDRNRNGVIESTEWKSASPLFHRLDRDRDSVLSWDEFMGSTERYDRPFGWR